MMRRVSNVAVRRAVPVQANALVSRRNFEVAATWWLASWMVPLHCLFIVQFPLMYMDLMAPGFGLEKVPLVHFLNEKSHEARLRGELDAVHTTWSEDLDTATIDDAVSRTF